MQSGKAQVPPQSARTFVEGFYKWYLPEALRDHGEPSWLIALRVKGENFDPRLVRLLRADAAAQAKCDDLVGLDFDPFLNSQDPSPEYAVREIRRHGHIYRAEIYSVQSGQKSSTPDVTAIVEQTRGRWRFVNFYYPRGADLLTTLKLPKLSCSSLPPIRKH